MISYSSGLKFLNTISIAFANEVSSLIFGNTDRDYFIVESTHSSLTVPSTLLFNPDKFILPASKYYGINFTKLTKNYLEFRRFY